MFNVYNSGNPADDAANRQRDLIAQIMAAQAAGVPLQQYQQGLGMSPQRLDEAPPSDPATEGDAMGGNSPGGLGPAGLGAVSASGISNSVAAQAPGDTLGGLLSGFSIGDHGPGTGLGMAQTGYSPGYGALADDVANTVNSVIDAMDVSTETNNAVDDAGYTSPGYTSPDPGQAIANDIAGSLTDVNATANDIAGGYSNDNSGGGLGGFGGISGGGLGGGLGAGLSGEGGTAASGPGGDGTSGANSGGDGGGGGGGGSK